jgi:hypothetical protein
MGVGLFEGVRVSGSDLETSSVGNVEGSRSKRQKRYRVTVTTTACIFYSFIILYSTPRSVWASGVQDAMHLCSTVKNQSQMAGGHWWQRKYIRHIQYLDVYIKY